jgi:putative hydrolase of the HAD superfamily
LGGMDAAGTKRPPGTSIRAVLYDLFHTLVDVNEAPGTPTPSILGIEPGIWTRKVFDESPHHALGEEPDSYESLRRIAHAIDPGIPEERIREAVVVRRGRFRHALRHVRGEVLAHLAGVRARGLKTALVSNASFDEVASWPESPLAPHFDAALFSCHERMMKPDVRIYARAAERLGVVPAECLFVGDGGSREHQGAHAAGMRSVLFLGFLNRSAPAIAAGRDRGTDFLAESFEELEILIERLAREARAAGGE